MSRWARPGFRRSGWARPSSWHGEVANDSPIARHPVRGSAVMRVVHALQGAMRMSAESPQNVRRPVPRSAVIAHERVDCGTINQTRVCAAARRLPLSASSGALEAPDRTGNRPLAPHVAMQTVDASGRHLERTRVRRLAGCCRIGDGGSARSVLAVRLPSMQFVAVRLSRSVLSLPTLATVQHGEGVTSDVNCRRIRARLGHIRRPSRT